MTNSIELHTIIICFSDTHVLTVGLVAAALDVDNELVHNTIREQLFGLFHLRTAASGTVWPQHSSDALPPSHGSHIIVPIYCSLLRWLSSPDDLTRIGNDFWIDVMNGHNMITALFLKFCANKSIAIEHPLQQYLKIYGPSHLRNASRGLRFLTQDVRKIDETANIRGVLPLQLGYVSGLQASNKNNPNEYFILIK